jgi:arabinofuranosyltransferase
MAWSYVTYRSFLPNTFFAKRNVDIGLQELLGQGIFYLKLSLIQDAAGALVLLGALVLVLVKKQRLSLVLMSGVVVYGAYTISIGGDFMVGRFLSTPIYVAALSIPFSLKDSRLSLFGSLRDIRKLKDSRGLQISMLVCLVLFVSLSVPAVSLSRQPYERFDWQQPASRGVADERGFYATRGRGLDLFVREWALARSKTQCSTGNTSDLCVTMDDFSIIDISRQANGWPSRTAQTPLLPKYTDVTCGGLGAKSILSGPETHWIDACGLTDRFLAGVTFEPKQGWRIGHFVREIPDGYYEAVAFGDPKFVEDPQVRQEVERVWKSIRRPR